MIGYCPQTNPIFDTMSVEEHIMYYARIKGVHKSFRTEQVENAIAELGLTAHRKKLASELSGGNKRKLAVAMATVGRPPIILLDEPSAGMDPEARRFMWDVVGNIASKKTSAVVLTTHSMEEAEALSTKMGIMVKGGIFKCFGSSQHIKDKFGTGYVIEIKVRTPDEEELKEVIAKFIPETAQKNGATIDINDAVKEIQSSGMPAIIVDHIRGEVQQSGQNNSSGTIEAENEQNAPRSLSTIKTSNFAGSLITQGGLFGVITELSRTFEEVSVIEKYGNYMRLRVPRGGETIGAVFALIEEIKDDCDVSEYSVSQTTLE